jgi:hypothetical protein
MTSLLLLPVLLHLPGITAAGYFFSDHGFLNNSCPISPCGTCGVGQYRLGCAKASAGVCANCTGIPNATFSSHGWFNDSCNFTCREGFIAGPGRSCTQVIMRYTVEFQVSITLAITATKAFNMTEYIRGVAKETGCGPCGNVSLNPAACGECKIKYEYTTSVPVVYRRLLASASQVDVKTTITVDDNKKLAEAAAASITPESLAANLPGVGSVTVTSAPKVAVQTIVAPPPPPPPPPPVNTPTPPPAGGESSNIGAIAGGVAGGVVGLILIVVAVVFFTKSAATPAPAPPAPPTAPTPTASRFVYRQTTRQGTENNPRLASQLLYVQRR